MKGHTTINLTSFSITDGTIYDMLLPPPIFIVMMRSVGAVMMATSTLVCAVLFSLAPSSFLICLIAHLISSLMFRTAITGEDG
jgi:hypothetical protein